MVLRFGRAKFLVKELCYPRNDSVLKIHDEEKQMLSSNSLIESDSECRICRSTDYTEDNPLISPCKCSGSIKYIHIECIRAWYETKMTRYENNSTISYTIKGLKCEICQQEFYTEFTCNGIQYDLVNLSRSKANPFLLLESIGYENLKIIYICKLSPDTVLAIVFFL